MWTSISYVYVQYCDCIINSSFNEVHIPSWLIDWFPVYFFLISLNSIEDAFSTHLIITAVNIYQALKLNNLIFETVL